MPTIAYWIIGVAGVAVFVPTMFKEIRELIFASRRRKIFAVMKRTNMPMYTDDLRLYTHLREGALRNTLEDLESDGQLERWVGDSPGAKEAWRFKNEPRQRRYRG